MKALLMFLLLLLVNESKAQYLTTKYPNLVYLNRYGEIRTNPFLIPRTRDYTLSTYYQPKLEERVKSLGLTKKEEVDLWSLDKRLFLVKEKGNLEPIKRESLTKLNIK